MESRPPDTARISRRPRAADRTAVSTGRPVAPESSALASTVSSKVARLNRGRLLFRERTPSGAPVESQGPLAILWVGIGLCCFYIALVWLNTLLGFFLTPLFIIPATWLMDFMKGRKQPGKDPS